MPDSMHDTRSVPVSPLPPPPATSGEDGRPSQAWADEVRKRLIGALEWDLPRPMSASYGPHEQAFRDGYADCYRLHRAVIQSVPLARARVDYLEQLVLDTIEALDEGSVREHLESAYFGGSEATDA